MLHKFVWPKASNTHNFIALILPSKKCHLTSLSLIRRIKEVMLTNCQPKLVSNLTIRCSYGLVRLPFEMTILVNIFVLQVTGLLQYQMFDGHDCLCQSDLGRNLRIHNRRKHRVHDLCDTGNLRRKVRHVSELQRSTPYH